MRLVPILFCAAALAQTPASKPSLTLDDFFNSVDISSVRIAPDGRAVAIETSRADWDANRFRTDLWLYRDQPTGAGALVQLTQSGHDRNPEFSPDGRWIAFLSDRGAPAAASTDAPASKPEKSAQVYVISLNGGEPFPVTQSDEEIHAFAWSADSRQIYFATRVHWAKDQQEAYKKDWKDVVEFRESERGDTIHRIEISEASNCLTESPAKTCDLSMHASQLASTPWRVKQLETSPNGKHIAFLTDSRTERWESLEAYGIYLIDSAGGEPRKLLQREAILDALHWSSDSRHIFFSFLNGSVDGPYQDAQSRVYWVDTQADTSAVARWAPAFQGAIAGFAALHGGGLIVQGRLGTEVQLYTSEKPTGDFALRPGSPGTYEKIAAAAHAPSIAFVHSSLQEPVEVWLASDPADLSRARPITSFNHLFTERALPEGEPYRWTADDGVTVEGMLIYPPGHFRAKHLRMLTLIHGGPADADGNQFGADWYRWAGLVATQGWLVFEPNYRGSIGYGDKFTLGIIPKIVSKPGREILEGVDALVKDGIADPEHLAIGGYSYGGYLTNWLITQTNRFKAAVTGAGAVEHVANWGNDDTTFDDAHFLGGLPWEAQQNYNDEAAIWQINKVKTPTHIVSGAEDVRVYVGEAYLLERALHTQGVPSKLLIFPGEGHELDKNPWHGKIKVREELKWLEKAMR
jgi:dipeptidyl aminopeptidase/acylaminoacyl peptidase